MKSSLRFALPVLLASAFATNLIVNPLPAAAEQVRTPGSYLGAGVALGSNNGTVVGGNVAGRYKFEDAPISLRTSVLFGNGGTAIVPTISYDVPLGDRTNVYLGAGGSFTTNNSSLTGDRNAFALQPGVEFSIAKNVLLYGNAIIALDSYQGISNRAATAVQGGIGFQF
jgi:hypothetical protein